MMISVPLCSSAQGRIQFAYDAAGNRVSREIVIAKKSLPAAKTNSYYNDRINESDVRIYPNSTKGEITIALNGNTGTKNCHVEVYSTGGSKIYSAEIENGSASVDISNQLPGIYILNISVDDKETSWKIIKQ